jgi:hypothetical protein
MRSRSATSFPFFFTIPHRHLSKNDREKVHSEMMAYGLLTQSPGKKSTFGSDGKSCKNCDKKVDCPGSHTLKYTDTKGNEVQHCLPMESTHGHWRLRNGMEYTGEIKDGMFHGWGRVEWIDVEKGFQMYEGEWHQSTRRGVGRREYPDGEILCLLNINKTLYS